jgi:hypothetical protein
VRNVLDMHPATSGDFVAGTRLGAFRNVTEEDVMEFLRATIAKEILR